ncbi:hypothetical protein HU200_005706 [Digitaria exilis]|uniref:Uncharacterized protein n=1 Tax=Digitaria exilis TaxID=1010633 RepID=A0A835KR99_9POAL|nr:hypothetical protein HU200_005706 [Digitaria exilis]
MALLGIVRLVALVLLVVFSCLFINKQALIGKCY